MVSLNALFGQAGLDDNAMSALARVGHDQDLGLTIMAGLGDANANTLEKDGHTEVLCVRLLIDDSSSIGFTSQQRPKGNTQLVINGHNQILDALGDSKAAGGIYISTQYLNEPTPLFPFVLLGQAIPLDKNNYVPGGRTPLYDMTAASLATVAAKMAEFEDGGVAVRSATYIITDGANFGSRTYHQPEDVAPIVAGMLKQESHIIGAMGIDDGETDFRDVFGRMGLQDKWILTPGNSPAEIRRAFDTMSQSATRISQAAGSFSQAAMGGFGGGTN